jgi:hypothetical protein
MEMVKASVVEVEKKHFIEIEGGEHAIRIPISEDKPNQVKGAFNALIARLKKGVFQIELQGVGEDLFSQVAKEYVTQLNREIKQVRKEMEEHSLTT